MKGKQIREITDASIIVALYGIVFLLSRFLGGQLEYSISFVLPLPIAIYAYKYNFKKSLVPFVATVIISIFLTSNPFTSIFIILPITFSGTILGGILIKKNVTPIYSILILALFSSVMEVLSGIVFSKLLGVDNIFVDISNTINEIGSLININTGDFVVIQAFMEGLIPSIIITISLLSSLTSYLIFIILIRRIFKDEIKGKILEFFSLDSFIPKSFTIAYCLVLIASLFACLMFKSSEGFIRILYIILINISLIVGVMYFYFGLKLVAMFIRNLNKKWLLIIEFILILVAPFLFVIIGVVDNLKKNKLY